MDDGEAGHEMEEGLAASSRWNSPCCLAATKAPIKTPTTVRTGQSTETVTLPKLVRRCDRHQLNRSLG